MRRIQASCVTVVGGESFSKDNGQDLTLYVHCYVKPKVFPTTCRGAVWLTRSQSLAWVRLVDALRWRQAMDPLTAAVGFRASSLVKGSARVTS